MKNTPSPNDRIWGLDLAGSSNAGFELKKILQLGDYINVKDFGAIGSGLVDDRDAINQAATFAASVGKTLWFPSGNYFVSNSVNLPAGTRLHGYGAKIFNLGSHIYLLNINSNTIIKGLELEGAGAIPFNDLGRGINIVGTVGSYKSGIQIEDCYIHDLGFYGIYNQFAQDIIVENTKVYNVGYAGIMNLSVSKCHISNSHIKGINYHEGGYNISFTRFTTVDTLEVNPRSSDCSVSDCLIEDNLQWKGLDTHGGENIMFINNRIFNCRQGIGIVAAGQFASYNCIAKSNTIITARGSDVGPTWSAYGIAVAGVSSEDLSDADDFAKNNIVEGNILIGCGQEGNLNEGAIRFRHTLNLRVIGNIIQKPLVNGIVITNTNYNFTVAGNAIEDSNSSQDILTVGIKMVSQYNTGSIIGNNTSKIDPDLNLKVGERGIFVATATNNILIIKGNQSTFDNPESLPTSINIATDHIFTNTIQINKESAPSNTQIVFNEGFSIRANNISGLHPTDKRSFWIQGAPDTTVFISPQSGQYEWIGLNARTIDITGGQLRIAGSLNTLEPSGIQLNVSGDAESGLAFKNGIHYTVITQGLSNNYPEGTGMSRVWKAEDSRIYEEFSNSTGDLWYRCLSISVSNEWKKVLTDAFLAEIYTQTTDPLVAGQLWNNGGVLTFSNG